MTALSLPHCVFVYLFVSSIQMNFLRRRFGQNSTVLKPFGRQKVNVRCGLLQELYGVRRRVPSEIKKKIKNPCPTSTCCTQNDVMTVLFCLSCRHKKSMYILLCCLFCLYLFVCLFFKSVFLLFSLLFICLSSLSVFFFFFALFAPLFVFVFSLCVTLSIQFLFILPSIYHCVSLFFSCLLLIYLLLVSLLSQLVFYLSICC